MKEHQAGGVSSKRERSMDLTYIPELVNATLRDWNTPGAAVAVIRNREVAYCEGFGLRSVTESLPVTPDTVFPIASSTKAFTALCIGILCDEGILDWDHPIRHYVPDFEMYDPLVTMQITARDMACHRSGLARHDLMWYKNNSTSREDIVRRLRHLQPNVPFRTKWQYSNLIYTALGHAVELVSQMTWEDFVQERILSPLGMKRTTTSNRQSQVIGDFAHPCGGQDSEPMEIPFYPADFELTGPAGGLKSSVSDLAKWLLVNMNDGKSGEMQLFPERQVTELQTPHIPCSLNPWEEHNIPLQTYGLGWFIESYRGTTVVHHGGHIDGFSSLVSFMPDVGMGIAVLANRTYVPVPEIVTRSIYDTELGFDTDWNAYYRERQQSLEVSSNQTTRAQSNQEGARQTSHDLPAYAGLYDNPGYGQMTVHYDEESLVLHYNELSFALTHIHYDVFEFTYTSFNLTRAASFQTGLNGEIDGVIIQMESASGVDPIAFRRG